MGVYVRKDSPFYWLLLEGDPRSGRPSVREATKVRRDGVDAAVRKENRRLALLRYYARMAECVRPGPRPPVHLDEFVRSLLLNNRMPRSHRNQLGRAIAKQIIDDLGPYTLQELGPKLVKSWITLRRRQRRTVRENSTGPAPRMHPLNREVEVLRAILKAAVPEHLPASPLDGAKLPTR